MAPKWRRAWPQQSSERRSSAPTIGWPPFRHSSHLIVASAMRWLPSTTSSNLIVASASRMPVSNQPIPYVISSCDSWRASPPIFVEWARGTRMIPPPKKKQVKRGRSLWVQLGIVVVVAYDCDRRPTKEVKRTLTKPSASPPTCGSK